MQMRLLLLALLLGCTSCQPYSPAEKLLDDYLTRLARVLSQTKPVVAQAQPPRLPDEPQLYQRIEPIKIDLLDYWAFRECGLTLLLSERNSILGRVMRPSQHLHMDGRLVRKLTECETQLQDPQLLQLTRNLLREKRAQWPARYWNATIAAPELRQFWSIATAPLSPLTEATYTPADNALRELVALPHKLYAAEWPEIIVLESHYQQLELYQLGGKLLQSLQLSHNYLAAANYLLEDAARKKTLCPQGKQIKQMDYARNVMQKYFIAKVQPWLAAINQRANLLLPLYQQLIKQQDAQLQRLIQPFYQQVINLHEVFLKQNRVHVAHWQALFEICGSSAVQLEINHEK